MAVALEGHHVFLSVPVCTIIFAEWIICVLGTMYVSLVDVWGSDGDRAMVAAVESHHAFLSVLVFRQHWFLLLLLVCDQDLQCSQSGLVAPSPATPFQQLPYVSSSSSTLTIFTLWETLASSSLD